MFNEGVHVSKFQRDLFPCVFLNSQKPLMQQWSFQVPFQHYSFLELICGLTVGQSTLQIIDFRRKLILVSDIFRTFWIFVIAASTYLMQILHFVRLSSFKYCSQEYSSNHRGSNTLSFPDFGFFSFCSTLSLATTFLFVSLGFDVCLLGFAAAI